MADTRFGNFQQLAQGNKPMTAKEAWIMLNELGLLAQEFVPGATSVRKLLEGKPKEALYELADWIPGNAALQNFVNGKEQDWVRNALDAMVIAKPFARGAKKVMEAVENVPKGGNGGFITVSKGDKLKDILTRAEEAGQGLTKKEEERIRKIIGYINEGDAGNRKSMSKFLKETEHLNPNERQVLNAFVAAKPNLKNKDVNRNLKKLDLGDKPEGFDNWPAKERLDFMDEHGITSFDAGEPGYGVIHPGTFSLSDYDKALYDKALEEKAAQAAQAAQAAKQAPITMTEVQDLSTGIIPGQSSVPKGGTRPTYDHSKQFMDTELKQVPGIDRTGMSYGDDTDAFYDIYKAWRDSKPDVHTRNVSKYLGYDVAGTESLRNLSREAREGKNRSMSRVRQTDPYYNAGIVGDENKRLWDKIKLLRDSGKSDEEIRSILQKDLNKYQGDVERLKARMPSKAPNKSMFNYEGANTMVLKATPSEEARALKALGIDTPEYDELERLGNFYRVFFPQ